MIIIAANSVGWKTNRQRNLRRARHRAHRPGVTGVIESPKPLEDTS